MKILHTISIAVLISACGSTQPVARTADFGPETLKLINSYRASRGLSPLIANEMLTALARQHSRYQAVRGNINHDGFRQRSAKAKAAGFSGVCTENVGVRYKSAQQLFSGWRNSAGHNTNLLRPNMRYAGVAVVGAYSTFFACG